MSNKPIYGDNAFAFLAYVNKLMRKTGYSIEEIRSFEKEATSSDYDHLVETCKKYMDILKGEI